MRDRCPFATWRPLGDPSDEPYIGTPSVLVFHTMVGWMDTTRRMFASGGYDGTESHFGVGMDGRIEQWQALDRQADAQWDGNAYATSIETEDGGDYLQPWTPAQADALVRLTIWWAEETGNPIRLVSHPRGRGIGYHRQFYAWNKSNHACPGDTRIDQLKHEIIPRARRGDVQGRDEDDMLDTGNKHEVTQWQQRLRKYYSYQGINALPKYGVDGDWGDETVEWTRKWQHEVGLDRGAVTAVDYSAMALTLVRMDDPTTKVGKGQSARGDDRSVLEFARLNRARLDDIWHAVKGGLKVGDVQVDAETLADALGPKLGLTKGQVKDAVQEALREGVGK